MRYDILVPAGFLYRIRSLSCPAHFDPGRECIFSGGEEHFQVASTVVFGVWVVRDKISFCG